jgi:hypothetical protein
MNLAKKHETRIGNAYARVYDAFIWNDASWMRRPYIFHVSLAFLARPVCDGKTYYAMKALNTLVLLCFIFDLIPFNYKIYLLTRKHSIVIFFNIVYRLLLLLFAKVGGKGEDIPACNLEVGQGDTFSVQTVFSFLLLLFW